MSAIFDPINVILLGIAIFIFINLRSVLGKRTGNERRPPDGFGSQNRDDEQPDDRSDNVVSLSDRSNSKKTQADKSTQEEDEVVAPVDAALAAIMKADPDFDKKTFIEGSKAAYEMIVTAFATGDKKTLKRLLGKEVYDGFVSAIDQREKDNHTVDFSFVGLDAASIIETTVENDEALVTVRFVSKIISSTRDTENHVIDGDPTEVRTVRDIWTFVRDLSTRDPNWKLVGSEAAD